MEDPQCCGGGSTGQADGQGEDSVGEVGAWREQEGQGGLDDRSGYAADQ